MATELKLKTFKYSKVVAVDDQPGEWQADRCPHVGLLKGLRPCQSQPATPQAPVMVSRVQPMHGSPASFMTGAKQW